MFSLKMEKESPERSEPPVYEKGYILLENIVTENVFYMIKFVVLFSAAGNLKHSNETPTSI